MAEKVGLGEVLELLLGERLAEWWLGYEGGGPIDKFGVVGGPEVDHRLGVGSHRFELRGSIASLKNLGDGELSDIVSPVGEHRDQKILRVAVVVIVLENLLHNLELLGWENLATAIH